MKLCKNKIIEAGAAAVLLVTPVVFSGCSNNAAKPKTARVTHKKAEVKVPKATIAKLDSWVEIDRERSSNTPRKSDKKFNDARQKVRLWKASHTKAEWQYYKKHSQQLDGSVPGEFDTNKMPIDDVVKIGIAVNKARLDDNAIPNSDAEQQRVDNVTKQGQHETKALQKRFGEDAYGMSLIELTDAWTDSDGKRGREIKAQVQSALAGIKQQVGADIEPVQYYQADA